MKNASFFFLAILTSLCSFGQLRYCDMEVKIAYPDSGHYYISPGQDSVGYWVINHGPDTFMAGDAFWLRIRLSNVYFDPPTIVQLDKPIYPGDSARFSRNFTLNYYNHRPDITLCLWLRAYEAAGNSKMYWEEDSAAMFENNFVCRSVAHNRLASTTDLSLSNNLVYPNPFSNLLKFNFSYENVIIVDVTGKRFYNGQESLINTTDWPNGVYFAVIYYNDGIISTKKLVKI